MFKVKVRSLTRDTIQNPLLASIRLLMNHIVTALLIVAMASCLFTNTANANSNLAEKAKSAILNENLDDASDAIEQAIEESPTQADLYKLAGDIYASRAQSASIFSAPGLAKKSLKSYKRAVKLAPDNTRYRKSLMQYYLMAPGIVGGDKKLGADQVKAIETLDSIQGTIAKTLLYLSKEDADALKRLYSELPKEQSNHPEIKLAKANYLAQTDQVDDALIILTELANTDPAQFVTEDTKLIPYKAMLQSGFIGLRDDAHAIQGAESFKRYLANAPDTYRLVTKNWAIYFLGLSYASLGENELANEAYNKARQNTNSKALIKEIKSAQKKVK